MGLSEHWIKKKKDVTIKSWASCKELESIKGSWPEVAGYCAQHWYVLSQLGPCCCAPLQPHTGIPKFGVPIDPCFSHKFKTSLSSIMRAHLKINK